MEPSKSVRPIHGDIWERNHVGMKFSVMHVCGHHDPPHVTGYWWKDGGPSPCAHASFPLPRFLAMFALVESEYGGADASS